MMEQVNRPWGWYAVIATGGDFQIKTLFIEPHKRLSLQSHEKRSEHWFVLRGELTVNDSLTILKGGSHDCPAGKLHRLENKTDVPVVIIEIQTGTYFGEDDIIRYEDDFGRLDDNVS